MLQCVLQFNMRSFACLLLVTSGSLHAQQVLRCTPYMPVHVPGALFSVGDGHAAQGDGEVNLTAIESPLTGVFRLRFERT